MTAPRILVVMPDQGKRALIRAALREVGYDAIGATNLEEARRYRAIEPGRGTVRLLVVEQDATANATDELHELLASHHDPPAVLIAHATHDVPAGPWSRILRRPVSVAEIVAAVESEVSLPDDARHPMDGDS